jgi:FkbM family methyltransferase
MTVGFLRRLRNVRGIALELARGWRVMADWRSRLRWSSDVVLLRILRERAPQRPRTVRLMGDVRIRYRLNLGDMEGIREVWLDETYRFPGAVTSVDTIVDLGANIGLTSVYLAKKHGCRRLVAVEPVPGNVELLRENLALNSVPAEVVEAVVALDDGVAHFQEVAASNRGQVGESGREVRAVSMPALLDRLGSDVDMLKVDIEGSEQELFGAGAAWLRKVRSIMVEFHTGLVDKAALVDVIEREGFRFIPVGSVNDHSTDAFIREHQERAV